MEAALIAAAEKDEVPYNDEQWQRSAPFVRAALKGLMARDLYDNGSYVRSTNPLNPVYMEALRLVCDPERYNQLINGSKRAFHKKS